MNWFEKICARPRGRQPSRHLPMPTDRKYESWVARRQQWYEWQDLPPEEQEKVKSIAPQDMDFNKFLYRPTESSWIWEPHGWDTDETEQEKETHPTVNWLEKSRARSRGSCEYCGGVGGQHAEYCSLMLPPGYEPPPYKSPPGGGGRGRPRIYDPPPEGVSRQLASLRRKNGRCVKCGLPEGHTEPCRIRAPGHGWNNICEYCGKIGRKNHSPECPMVLKTPDSPTPPEETPMESNPGV